MSDPFLLSSYQFQLPSELIARYPVQPRDSSRLLIVNRSTGALKEIVFRELIDFLEKGDSLVFNNTKVIPARLIGTRSGGGKTEIFLLKVFSDGTWNVLAKPGKKLPVGSIVVFGDHFQCEVLETFMDGSKRVFFHCQKDEFDALIKRYGSIPLPHYLERDPDESDKVTYQTVYAAKEGAVAAPTAGLHFTESLLTNLSMKGVSQTFVTLHTGMGTFRPVQTDDIREHRMHAEYLEISPQAAKELSSVDNNARQICVGTTCCRALESVMQQKGAIIAGQYETSIFIYPGYSFRYVRSLLTNFHLPGSTLLMLTCAFGGRELIMEAYEKAVKERFRFFSYGDAMLIVD